MRRGAGLAALVLLATPLTALGQVTVNPGALNSLPREPAHHAPTRRAPVRRPPPHSAPHSRTPPAPIAAPAKPAGPPAIPTVPPAIANIPPPIAVPVAHPPPVPTVPEAPDAPGSATPITNGVRVTFGPDRSDLNPATEAALRAFADSVKADETKSINVYAYAAGNADDPSTPRRLSLARALAARAVLINAGIASPRIYPRALGPAGGDTDRDRVDVVTGIPGPPAATSPAAPTQASAPATPTQTGAPVPPR